MRNTDDASSWREAETLGDGVALSLVVQCERLPRACVDDRFRLRGSSTSIGRMHSVRIKRSRMLASRRDTFPTLAQHATVLP
jgi:hypothetical protein